VKPTPPGLLVAIAVAVGALVYAVVSRDYNSLPPVPLYSSLTIGFLAAAEFFSATSVRARLRGEPGTRPIDPLVVARLVALAKASAYGGVLALGGYSAFLGYTSRQLDNPAKAHDAAASGTGVVLSLALVAAALFLERVCRAPEPPDDDTDDEDIWDPVADWHRDDRRR
jgi:Protein of unknown function (DUF3180)